MWRTLALLVCGALTACGPRTGQSCGLNVIGWTLDQVRACEPSLHVWEDGRTAVVRGALGRGVFTLVHRDGVVVGQSWFDPRTNYLVEHRTGLNSSFRPVQETISRPVPGVIPPRF